MNIHFSKKYLIILILILIIVFLGFYIKQFASIRAVSFQTIEKRSVAGIFDKKEIIIRDQSPFDTFWKELHSVRKILPKAPQIDFKKQMLIGVFQGKMPTGGYSIKVTGITQSWRTLRITLQELTPAPECIVSQAETSPYHLISLPASRKNIIFQKTLLKACKEE